MYNNKNYAIMEKAIKLLKLVDEFNFIEVYIVISTPAIGIRAIESCAFLTYEEAQNHCDWLNKTRNTDIYRVYHTSAHV